MVIKAREAMGTKYIINVLEGEFAKVLADAEAAGNIVDLEGCMLGPVSASNLRKYYSRVEIINSGDERLNELLKRNTITSTSTYKAYPVLDLETKNPTVKDFSRLMNELEPGSKWTPTHSTQRQKALSTLLILARPDVEFDLYACGYSIYNFISNEWKVMRKEHDKYIEFCQPGIIERDVINGSIRASSTDALRADLYVSKYNVLPADFGNKMLIEKGEDGKLKGEWSRVVEKCIRTLCVVKTNNKKLSNFLEMRTE